MPDTREKQKNAGDDGRRLFTPAGRTKRRPEAIADRVKDYIRSENLVPGDRLPQERELIDRFKAAKGTVREAMKALETQGLVFTRSGPGGGAFVAAPSARNAMELLSTYFFFEPPTLSDIYALRKLLEPEVAGLLAGRLTRDQLAALEATIGTYDRPPADADEQYRQRVAELDFHSQLAQLCPNPLLGFLCGLMHNLLRELPVARRIYDDPAPNARDEGLSFQYRLIDALKTGRAGDARRIAAAHMVFAEAYMRACAQATEGDPGSGAPERNI
jgi:DNA-binding FadR family transcriptional regulator